MEYDSTQIGTPNNKILLKEFNKCIAAADNNALKAPLVHYDALPNS